MNPTVNPVEVTARPLRLWPGVVLLALQWLLRFAVPVVLPDAGLVGFIGSLVCGVAIIAWWLFFSRVAWADRLGVLVFIAAALFVTSRLVHPSIAGGMMGMMLPIFAVPVICLALVASAYLARNQRAGRRRAVVAASLALACGGFTLLRTGGITSEGAADFQWRWSPTPEDRLLAHGTTKPTSSSPERPPVAVTPSATTAAWPGFRGPNRDSIIRGTRIATSWTASPPKELWRRQVGPGWSSFAVSDGRIYTQEQRGEDELVSCYSLATGESVWRHGNPARFYESNAGAGPRGTPTLHEGRVYTFGATGVVNALDARTGQLIWSRDAAADTKKKAPDWGFSSSPLVTGDLVIVAATGSLVAYDLATGAPRWFGPSDGKSYCSPHLLEIHGVPQVILMSGAGATSVAPLDGKVLWQHAWKDFAIVQPAQIRNGELLISTGDRAGVRRIDVTKNQDGWSTEERWTSNRMKPYFNDLVLHRGHAYGFDNGILACIDLAGERKWKGGRYGRGQVLLLADQDVLLILAEQGDVALVRAAPEAFAELARFKAIEGKTWNHPVLVDEVLLVRNDQEMAAFRLP